MSIIEYCIFNGFSDIAVFLQSVATNSNNMLFASIPAYEIETVNLSQK